MSVIRKVAVPTGKAAVRNEAEARLSWSGVLVAIAARRHFEPDGPSLVGNRNLRTASARPSLASFSQ